MGQAIEAMSESGGGWRSVAGVAVAGAVVVATMVVFWSPQPGSTEFSAAGTPVGTRDARPPTELVAPATPTARATALPDGAVAFGRYVVVSPEHAPAGCGVPAGAGQLVDWTTTRLPSFANAPQHELLVEPDGMPANWELREVFMQSIEWDGGQSVDAVFAAHYTDGEREVSVLRWREEDACRVSVSPARPVDPEAGTPIDLGRVDAVLVTEEPLSVVWSEDGVTTVVEGAGLDAPAVLAAAAAVLGGGE